MRTKILAVSAAAMLCIAAPAHAHDGRHGNFFLGLGAGIAAVGIGSALLSGPSYAPPPAVVYQAPPVYYAPPPTPYYPTPYAPTPYYPTPGYYYAPPPAYYYGPPPGY